MPGRFHVFSHGKESTIDDSHGNPGKHADPHAHDGIGATRGPGRELNEDEKIAYEEFTKYPPQYDEDGNPIDPDI